MKIFEYIVNASTNPFQFFICTCDLEMRGYKSNQVNMRIIQVVYLLI